MSKLYTIGYGNQPPEYFFARIPDDARIIDVRQRANSQFRPAYCGSALKAKFAERYHHEKNLGNPERNTDCWQPESHEAAHQSMLLIASRIITGMVYVLMCAELDPERCHRRFVAQAIAELVPGLEIVHL